jgi:hypothetical protein
MTIKRERENSQSLNQQSFVDQQLMVSKNITTSRWPDISQNGDKGPQSQILITRYEETGLLIYKVLGYVTILKDAIASASAAQQSSMTTLTCLAFLSEKICSHFAHEIIKVRIVGKFFCGLLMDAFLLHQPSQMWMWMIVSFCGRGRSSLKRIPNHH